MRRVRRCGALLGKRLQQAAAGRRALLRVEPAMNWFTGVVLYRDDLVDGAVRRAADRHRPVRSRTQPLAGAARRSGRDVTEVLIDDDWLRRSSVGLLRADPQRLAELPHGCWRCRRMQYVCGTAICLRRRRSDFVWLRDFPGNARILWTPAHDESSRTGEDCLLILPCDWRFLPKLGPLARMARGPSFSSMRSRALSRLFSHFRRSDDFISSNPCAAHKISR